MVEFLVGLILLPFAIGAIGLTALIAYVAYKVIKDS